MKLLYFFFLLLNLNIICSQYIESFTPNTLYYGYGTYVTVKSNQIRSIKVASYLVLGRPNYETKSNDYILCPYYQLISEFYALCYVPSDWAKEGTFISFYNGDGPTGIYETSFIFNISKPLISTSFIIPSTNSILIFGDALLSHLYFSIKTLSSVNSIPLTSCKSVNNFKLYECQLPSHNTDFENCYTLYYNDNNTQNINISTVIYKNPVITSLEISNSLTKIYVDQKCAGSRPISMILNINSQKSYELKLESNYYILKVPVLLCSAYANDEIIKVSVTSSFDIYNNFTSHQVDYKCGSGSFINSYKNINNEDYGICEFSNSFKLNHFSTTIIIIIIILSAIIFN